VEWNSCCSLIRVTETHSYANPITKTKPNPTHLANPGNPAGPNHNNTTRIYLFLINKSITASQQHENVGLGNNIPIPNTVYIQDYSGHQPALAVTDFLMCSTILPACWVPNVCEYNSMLGSRRVGTSIMQWIRYGDGAGNTTKGNSSISIIWMRWLPSARVCGQYIFALTEYSQFLTGGAG